MGKKTPQHSKSNKHEKNNKLMKKLSEVTRDSVAQWLTPSSAPPPEAPGPGSGTNFLQLDPWQQEALMALLEGKNIVVDAPTTAGKTRVVEAYFERNINDPGFRACYTCPVKSLSNDKLKEFREKFGKNNVGIATGDLKENLGAPIVVATLETYRNSLLGLDPDLGRKIVVFDEYHFIQDSSRGSSWEESMILTPPECQIVLLSASISNGVEFAKWLENLTGRNCEYIYVSERPVPLVDLVWMKDSWVLADLLPESYRTVSRPNLWRAELAPQHIVDRMMSVIDLALTPTIIYSSRRRTCVELAAKLKLKVPPLSPKAQQNIQDCLTRVNEITNVLKFIEQDLLASILDKGVAYHHSGHTPQVRMLIETLLKEGLLQFCVATMGLSLGINFFVRSTLISDVTRPGESGVNAYQSAEILQMLGRAGRRGKDKVGFNLWPTLELFQGMGKPQRQKGVSQLRADPTTMLGLMSRGSSLKQVKRFYGKSLMKFQYPKQEERFLSNLDVMHSHLQKIGALDKSELLTPYGEIAKGVPHAGGLFIAGHLHSGKFESRKMLEYCELIASFCLAFYKTPNTAPSYKFPFKESEIVKELERIYPVNLFRDLYDDRQRDHAGFRYRDFNPQAGYIVREWIEGKPWDKLVAEVTNAFYAEGDVCHLLFRVCSYLQALVQLDIPISNTAFEYKTLIMRDPVKNL